MNVTINDLKQYKLIKREVSDLEQRIKHEKRVTDVVTGSYCEPPYIKHPVSITGYSECYDKSLVAKYNRKIKILRRKAEDIEDYISTIDDSLLRQIIRLRFLDGLSWRAVSFKIGGGNTEASVIMTFKRYCENISC